MSLAPTLTPTLTPPPTLTLTLTPTLTLTLTLTPLDPHISPFTPHPSLHLMSSVEDELSQPDPRARPSRGMTSHGMS